MNIFVGCVHMDAFTGTESTDRLADQEIENISLKIDPGTSLIRCVFTACQFSDMMSGLMTDGVVFNRCTFHNVRFQGCDFIGATFIDCEFYNCTSIGTVTLQQDMGELFTIAVLEHDEQEGWVYIQPPLDYDFVADDRNYDEHREVVSGTRYATSL